MLTMSSCPYCICQASHKMAIFLLSTGFQSFGLCLCKLFDCMPHFHKCYWNQKRTAHSMVDKIHKVVQHFSDWRKVHKNYNQTMLHDWTVFADWNSCIHKMWVFMSDWDFTEPEAVRHKRNLPKKKCFLEEHVLQNPACLCMCMCCSTVWLHFGTYAHDAWQHQPCGE